MCVTDSSSCHWERHRRRQSRRWRGAALRSKGRRRAARSPRNPSSTPSMSSGGASESPLPPILRDVALRHPCRVGRPGAGTAGRVAKAAVRRGSRFAGPSPFFKATKCPRVSLDIRCRQARLYVQADKVMEVAAATRSHGLLALGALLVAPWLVVTDGFTTILAAPSIQDQLGTGDAGIRLIVAARPVAYSALLVAGGRIGDVHGRRGALIAGLTLFSLGSAHASAAPNEQLLVAARGLQGVGAAAMYPQVLALLRVSATTTRALSRAMVAWGVVLGLASGTAQLVGG